ncbi:hypothetical protein [Natrarchaeobius chitinivorans]|uniref:Uncharacterized protein n=1 Tax=Natrarchaeobius chitinivorans TaxID=1679083 RepID=A0A3N6ME15_NATCH|nr:hypothetical protein [Natrarchaeobius chitinivorans]RQG93821.1 hypothetical protein EA473_13975 [Natrarchaeobius chitinivorans]
MAPAIVHFLVGASLVVLLAMPLALRDGHHGRHLWLVAIGGLWGLFPDVHYVTPVLESELTALHDSQWANLFAFHYALDQPPIATRPLEATAASILLFLVAIGIFTGASVVTGRIRSSADRRAPVPTATRIVATGYAIAVAGIVAGVAAGLVFISVDGIEPMSTLVGAESARVGWLVLFALCLAGSAAFAALVFAVTAVTGSRPLPSSLLSGLLFGTVVWVGATVAVPIWMHVVLGDARPIPYVHRTGLVALGTVVVLLAIVYPLGYRMAAGSTVG